jgi:poly(3-hydroxybutyrate) depolymerase/flagellar basal body-associated protein FliL
LPRAEINGSWALDLPKFATTVDEFDIRLAGDDWGVQKMVRSLRWFQASVILVAVVCGSLFAGEAPSPGKQVEQFFVSPALPTEKFGYLLFLPKGYGTDNRRWPVMMFLHGSGERGNDLKLVKVHGPPKLVEERADFPFILISPQCPKDQWWPGDVQQQVLVELLDSVLTRFNADPQRVSLTGLSMGGFGSWTMAARYPNRFAAVVPICGGGDPNDALRLKGVPFWAFHGAKDFGVPLKLSEEMVAAVQQAGGEAKLTVYPEAGHDSWTETYKNEAVYDWLLAQRREVPAPLPTADPRLAFASVGHVVLNLGKPDEKNSFAAKVYLRTSPEHVNALRERIEPQREQLTAAIFAWVNSQTAEQLAGKAGRERTRIAARELCERIVFLGRPDLPFDVAFDLYFVRHNGKLKLEAK